MATGRIGTTPVLTTRWSKAPAAGTTSLSGLDDNSVSLVYSVGYEAVYRNGTLLSRGNDYTATNGTTITLVDATLTGDIIEVFANQTVPLTDTYSQTVANSLFVNQATFDAKGDLIAGTADNAYSRLAVGTNGQVLTAASTTSTGLAWTTLATPTSGLTLITRQTITNSSGTNIDSVFTSTYRTYLVVIEKMNNEGGSGQEDVYLQLRYGTTTQAGNYKYRQVTFGSSYSSTEQNSVSQITLCANAGQGSTASSHFVWFSGLGNSSERANFYGNSVDPNSGTPSYYNGLVNETQTYTGLRLTLSTGNFDATVAIYGLAKS